MPAKILDTHICLPLTALPTSTVSTLLQRAFLTYKWFVPRRYGRASLDFRLDPGQLELDGMLAYYEEHGSLCVAARTDRDFIWILPARHGTSAYTGMIIWVTSASVSPKLQWRAAHAEQVAELIRLVGSPLAFSALSSDLDYKTRYLIDRGTYSEEAMTIRNYSEGLAGLFWRNFYGPPFVRLFGERLNSLPPECVTRLGEELVLVQPYALPTEAGTEAARAREQQLISLLGPECFYDHEHHRPPTRRPTLPPVPWPQDT